MRQMDIVLRQTVNFVRLTVYKICPRIIVKHTPRDVSRSGRILGLPRLTRRGGDLTRHNEISIDRLQRLTTRHDRNHATTSSWCRDMTGGSRGTASSSQSKDTVMREEWTPLNTRRRTRRGSATVQMKTRVSRDSTRKGVVCASSSGTSPE